MIPNIFGFLTMNYTHFCIETHSLLGTIWLIFASFVQFIFQLGALIANFRAIHGLYNLKEVVFHKPTQALLIHDLAANLIYTVAYCGRNLSQFLDYLLCMDLLHNIDLKTCQLYMALFGMAPIFG